MNKGQVVWGKRWRLVIALIFMFLLFSMLISGNGKGAWTEEEGFALIMITMGMIFFLTWWAVSCVQERKRLAKIEAQHHVIPEKPPVVARWEGRRAELVREIERNKELSGPTRQLTSPVKGGEEYPLGVKGLIPLETKYPDGHSVMCWLFADEHSKDLLASTVDVINDVLHDASEIVNIELGAVYQLAFRPEMRMKRTVVNAGEKYIEWGFTRVVYEPFAKDGNPSKCPVTLHFVSDADTSVPGTYGGLVQHGQDGEVCSVWVISHTSFGESYGVTAKATKRDGLTVRKVERLTSAAESGGVIFKA